MKYGYFDDASREYVITSPQTPLPWINYLGNKDFFSLISNTAGGYCFYKDARLRRITRYRYNSVPADSGGRYFYIRDGNDFWSPGGLPVRSPLDFYECRHGLGYTEITGGKNGVRAAVLFFVPLDFSGEIHRVSLSNNSEKKKELRLYSFIEFCLWNAYDDMTNFQRNFSTGEVEVDGSVIYHKTEYRERRDHYSFYSVNAPITGFDTDRDSFLGPHNGFGNPAAVSASSFSSMADGWSPVASHCLEVDLAPGESKDFVFILGYAENPKEEKWEAPGVINKKRALAMIGVFWDTASVDRAFNGLKAYWNALLSRYTVQSGDEKLDRMVNIWNQYQCMVTFNLSRSASYYESGIGRGMGFRDSNQDILGFVHQIPERARERILDLAATQLPDGGAYHQYQPLTKKGNNEIGGHFNDDPLWLILATAAYIKESGDFNILEEQVPFDNDAGNSASLFEHLRRSFRHVTDNPGPHGLPLIGRADWNDCLNLNCFSETPDESYQTTASKDGKVAESVLIAAMSVFIGNEYARICENIGNYAEAKAVKKHIREMKATVMKHGYDGEWFLRAYDDFGNKVGSRENEEGRIFIETQGFCVMAGIGLDTDPGERGDSSSEFGDSSSKSGKSGDSPAIRALDSAWKYLDTPHGMVLVNPAYTRYHPELGEISSYPPGYKENAGVFCHNNPWIMIGETVVGRGGPAFECWSKIAPAYREEISDVHRTEPYVYSQMIAGKDAKRHGEAKNSWLTGTAAWNFIAISQYILGIRPDYEGLLLDPCIPGDWDGFKAVRKFRGAIYEIRVKNPDHVSKGLKSLLVDGNEIIGNMLPVFHDGKTHVIEAVMGNQRDI